MFILLIFLFKHEAAYELRISDWSSDVCSSDLAMVLGFTNRLLWGCPTAELVALYDANVSANHLDAGVATGYFLDRCRFPSPSPRLCLLDLNALCLATAAARVARYRPQTLQASVLAPVEAPAEPFDSLGITYLLHCLPDRKSTRLNSSH